MRLRIISIDDWNHNFHVISFSATHCFSLLFIIFICMFIIECLQLIMKTILLQARILIVILQASLESILMFVNYFPLFASLLRLKDAKRLPGSSVYIFNLGFSLRRSGI